jgi:membrane protease YdiL (CAAX protease family)
MSESSSDPIKIDPAKTHQSAEAEQRPSTSEMSHAESAQPVPKVPAVPPALSDREVWLEVGAVVAVGVLPHFVYALTSITRATVESFRSLAEPFWLVAMEQTAIGACVIYVTLYLIHRSGEPWQRFGLFRPSILDVGLGLVLYLWMRLAWPFFSGWVQADDGLTSEWYFPRPQQPLEYPLMVIWFLVGGFAEELVTRAYLITRFERLLQSKAVAWLLSTGLFTAYHCYQGVKGLTGILTFGMFFGAAYLCIRRVWPLAIAHALVNIIR